MKQFRSSSKQSTPKVTQIGQLGADSNTSTGFGHTAALFKVLTFSLLLCPFS